MSDIMDPSKLKVAELRAELQARGLDAKGNKPVLVERLRDALEAEALGKLEPSSVLTPLYYPFLCLHEHHRGLESMTGAYFLKGIVQG